MDVQCALRCFKLFLHAFFSVFLNIREPNMYDTFLWSIINLNILYLFYAYYNIIFEDTLPIEHSPPHIFEDTRPTLYMYLHLSI